MPYLCNSGVVIFSLFASQNITLTWGQKVTQRHEDSLNCVDSTASNSLELSMSCHIEHIDH